MFYNLCLIVARLLILIYLFLGSISYHSSNNDHLEYTDDDVDDIAGDHPQNSINPSSKDRTQDSINNKSKNPFSIANILATDCSSSRTKPHPHLHQPYPPMLRQPAGFIVTQQLDTDNRSQTSRRTSLTDSCASSCGSSPTSPEREDFEIPSPNGSTYPPLNPG